MVLAAPAAAACTPISIYFGWNSAAIAPDSRRALEELAVRLAWHGPDLDHVLLVAHADSSGSPVANLAMARRRAEAVRDVLLGNHVPERLIRIRSLGESALPPGTPVNVREPANRRVDLLLQLSARAQGVQLAEGRPIC
ncbi:MAG: outer membrane protein [Alphaproteobacteria bacterium]|nr:outer membrane protein [Alphaproteobacteria bacterium]